MYAYNSMYVLVCLWPYTINFKWAHSIISPRSISCMWGILPVQVETRGNFWFVLLPTVNGRPLIGGTSRLRSLQVWQTSSVSPRWWIVPLVMLLVCVESAPLFTTTWGSCLWGHFVFVQHHIYTAMYNAALKDGGVRFQTCTKRYLCEIQHGYCVADWVGASDWGQ